MTHATSLFDVALGSEDERFAVITVRSELDFLSVKEFGKAMVRAAAVSDGVVLDLLACDVCDSASLAVIAKQKYIMREGLQLVVAGGGAVRRAFEVTGLSGTSPMHATVSSALGTLRTSQRLLLGR